VRADQLNRHGHSPAGLHSEKMPLGTLGRKSIKMKTYEAQKKEQGREYNAPGDKSNYFFGLFFCSPPFLCLFFAVLPGPIKGQENLPYKCSLGPLPSSACKDYLLRAQLARRK
jgi:hypothetical protein